MYFPHLKIVAVCSCAWYRWEWHQTRVSGRCMCVGNPFLHDQPGCSLAVWQSGIIGYLASWDVAQREEWLALGMDRVFSTWGFLHDECLWIFTADKHYAFYYNPLWFITDVLFKKISNHDKNSVCTTWCAAAWTSESTSCQGQELKC